VSTADWQPYDVPGLANLLADQPSDSGTHASAWQQTYETLTDHRLRLEAARKALAQAWPAETNPSAAPFYAQIDALTSAMAATAETAVQSHAALTGIVGAVDVATGKVESLHRSWRQTAVQSGGVLLQDDWTRPLNDQAHVVMGEADVVIAENTVNLEPPVPYAPQVADSEFKALTSVDAVAGRQADHTSASPIADSDSALLSSHETSPKPSAYSNHSPTSFGATPHMSSAARPPEAALTGRGQIPAVAEAGAAARGSSAPSQRRLERRVVANTRGAETASPRPASLRGTSIEKAGPQGRISSPGEVQDASDDLVRARPAIAPSRSSGARFAIASEDRRIAFQAGNATIGEIAMPSTIAAAPANEFPARNGGGSDELPRVRTGESGVATPTELVSMAGPVPVPQAANATRRADRAVNADAWPMPIGVPAVIAPTDSCPIVHDPGLGVIGIDR
jgi:hypothetical protein